MQPPLPQQLQQQQPIRDQTWDHERKALKRPELKRRVQAWTARERRQSFLQGTPESVRPLSAHITFQPCKHLDCQRAVAELPAGRVCEALACTCCLQPCKHWHDDVCIVMNNTTTVTQG